jgi:hypothetical protein
MHSKILWWDVTHLEAGGTPVNELYCPFGLDCCDCCIYVLGNDVAPVDTGVTRVRRYNTHLQLHSMVVTICTTCFNIKNLDILPT